MWQCNNVSKSLPDASHGCVTTRCVFAPAFIWYILSCPEYTEELLRTARFLLNSGHILRRMCMGTNTKTDQLHQNQFWLLPLSTFGKLISPTIKDGWGWSRVYWWHSGGPVMCKLFAKEWRNSWMILPEAPREFWEGGPRGVNRWFAVSFFISQLIR